MRMYDVITHKRNGLELSNDEIRFFVEGFTSGEVADYQASALLMAIYFQGMTAAETALLTDYMARSGNMVDLSPIPGIKVDKHSTGGVGDKTTLIVAPMVAACGVPVAKMSGRGLGFSGGTVDKLEAIPGFQTTLDQARFFSTVKQTGLSVIGQSENIAPADKKIYALRDVTGTVESLPLIASSIMSKKLAAGSNAILLDVKTGSGAFMKTLEDSIALAKAMVEIGEHNGRRTVALITDMDTPLGYGVGSALEVIEAVETLKGNGPDDLYTVCLALASNMLVLAGLGDVAHCRWLAEQTIKNGEAFSRLAAMVTAQGGDARVLTDTSRFVRAPIVEPVRASSGGYIRHMDTEAVGNASVALGGGRTRKGDTIDHAAGILLRRKPGEAVQPGDVLAQLHTSNRNSLEQASHMLTEAIEIGSAPPMQKKTILARVTLDGVEML